MYYCPFVSNVTFFVAKIVNEQKQSKQIYLTYSTGHQTLLLYFKVPKLPFNWGSDKTG